MSCIFTNDNSVNIQLIEHEFSERFATRDEHEVGFRQISTFLINRKIIKRNIIDLGAWIGDNSIPWAKNISGLVYAIDPSPSNCEFIQKMCLANDIKNLKTIQKAISFRNEYVSTNDSIDHCAFGSDTHGRTVLEAVSLDFLFSCGEIKDIDYIHLDVEGMEFKVLYGSDTLLDICRPIVTFEQHLDVDDYSLIKNFLHDKNYHVFLIDEVLPGCRYDCRNSIAFPAEKYSYDLIKDIHASLGKHLLVERL